MATGRKRLRKPDKEWDNKSDLLGRKEITIKTIHGAAGGETVRHLFSTVERSGSKHLWACWMLGDVAPHPLGSANCTVASALASPSCPRPLEDPPSVAWSWPGRDPWSPFQRNALQEEASFPYLEDNPLPVILGAPRGGLVPTLPLISFVVLDKWLPLLDFYFYFYFIL